MARKVRYIEGVEVIDIADKGKAIGRAPDGRIVLVDGAVPGDIATVRVGRKKKGMLNTVVEEITAQSEHRTTPFCRHFGVCGGCKWQDLDYKEQLRLKEKAVRDAIRRIGGIEDPEILPIRGGDEQKYYRNKLEFTFTDSRWLTDQEIKSEGEFDRRGLGFHIPGNFARVLDLSECHLQPEPSNSIKNHVRELALEHGIEFQNINKRSGFLRNLLVRNNSEGEFMVALIVLEEDLDKIKRILEGIIEKFNAVTSVFYAVNSKLNDSIYDLEFVLYHGEAKLTETLGDKSFEIGPKSFFQTNRQQAINLYDIAVEMADLKGDELVYDLYCGIGSISLYVADSARHVVGIEENEAAIEDANANADRNQVQNVSFYAGDAKDVLLQANLSDFGRPELVITDPPRAGMHASVINSIIELGPERIVYVSCNPSTQARDIALLSEAYDFVKARPVDMFPHTSHIESVALLTKKS